MKSITVCISRSRLNSQGSNWDWICLKCLGKSRIRIEEALIFKRRQIKGNLNNLDAWIFPNKRFLKVYRIKKETFKKYHKNRKSIYLKTTVWTHMIMITCLCLFYRRNKMRYTQELGIL